MFECIDLGKLTKSELISVTIGKPHSCSINAFQDNSLCVTYAPVRNLGEPNNSFVPRVNFCGIVFWFVFGSIEGEWIDIYISSGKECLPKIEKLCS